MKTLSISITLAMMALTVHAQNNAVPAKSGVVATSEVSRFVDHPHNCAQMLGGGNDGDTLPAAYNVALNASLNEIGAPPKQAIAQIYLRCLQRMSDTKLSSLN
jgi:hypothetical protein